jgi:hypothetical protein
VSDQTASQETEKGCCRRSTAGADAGNGGAVYGLGLIGAAVYFWRRADSPTDRGLALVKALVWPAFLVYEAFDALQRKDEVEA